MTKDDKKALALFVGMVVFMILVMAYVFYKAPTADDIIDDVPTTTVIQNGF